MHFPLFSRPELKSTQKQLGTPLNQVKHLFPLELGLPFKTLSFLKQSISLCFKVVALITLLDFNKPVLVIALVCAYK